MIYNASGRCQPSACAAARCAGRCGARHRRPCEAELRGGDPTMRLSSDRILTTHAGSLPRPEALAQLLYDVIDEKPVDDGELAAGVRAAVADTVERQISAGIDIIS